MNPSCVHAVALNVEANPAKGFDSFSANSQTQTFALCDGANSCAGSGLAAQWLSVQMVNHQGNQDLGSADSEDALAHINRRVFLAHQEMLTLHPETGSTLVYLSATSRGLNLASLGDSYLRLYQPGWGGFGKWGLIHEMTRDINAQGNPTQLIGSEVCNTLHTHRLPPKGTYIAVMLSDGPGLAMDAAYIGARLSVLGRSTPSDSDLQYLCLSLAKEALNRGCTDDASVAIIWIRYK